MTRCPPLARYIDITVSFLTASLRRDAILAEASELRRKQRFWEDVFKVTAARPLAACVCARHQQQRYCSLVTPGEPAALTDRRKRLG